jgi:hypothetical protein
MRTSIAITLAFVGLTASSADAATLHALGADGKLRMIDTETRKASAAKPITGAEGMVVAVATRPADGKLYGLTDAGQIVWIDPASGKAMQVSRLDKKLETGARTAIKFNPVVDRLRVVGVSGQNYRINVDNGQVTVDGTLKYAAGTQFAGSAPMVTAAAYSNAYAGAKETALYTIDPMLASFNTQAPPNDGVQNMKAAIGMKLPYGLGFDIQADGKGGNWGWLVAGEALHAVDLAGARITMAGPIAGLSGAEIVSVAVAK